MSLYFKSPNFREINRYKFNTRKKKDWTRKIEWNITWRNKGIKRWNKKIKEENNELKVINNNFKKEIEKVNNTNGLLFELYSKVVSRFNDLFYEVRDKLNFRFSTSKNYTITYNGLISTKLQ